MYVHTNLGGGGKGGGNVVYRATKKGLDNRVQNCSATKFIKTAHTYPYVNHPLLATIPTEIA